jgi:hypothetical protein
MDKPADKEAMKRVADTIPTPSLDACASVPMRLVMLALAHRQGMDITRWLDQHLRSTLPQGLPPELCDLLFTTAGDSLPAWGRSLRSEEGNVDPSGGYTDRAFWDLVAAMGSEIHFAVKALEVRRSATGGHRLWTGEPPAFAHLIKADGKRQWFEKLAELGPCREYFRVLPQHLRRIEELRNDAPNLQQATGFLLGQLQVAARSKTGLRSAPRILLVGPPAAGKTWWAERVAAALGLPTCHLSMPCVTASFELAGNTAQWGSAKPGKILRAFLDSPSASPIIILDEIDKVLTRSDYRLLIGLLRTRREELGLTQAAVGAMIGWSQQIYSGVEACTRRLDVIEYFWIAGKLGMEFDEIALVVRDAIQDADAESKQKNTGA